MAWKSHNGEKLKYGRIPEDVRPLAAQALYKFNLETSPEKTKTVISSQVFSFTKFSVGCKRFAHIMPEDGMSVQQPDGSGRGGLGIQVC